MKLEESIKKNCVLFNESQREAEKKIASETGEGFKEVKYLVKRFFDQGFRRFVKKRENVEDLVREFDKYECKKSEIPKLASYYLLRKLDVHKLIFGEKLKVFERNICKEKLLVGIMKLLEEAYCKNKQQKNDFRYLNTNLKKCVESYLPYILSGGNKQNFNRLESGNLSSSQGDGAEHIFVAKAMIAGFNASVVDLGASGYDAVIENQENKLLRVQIKSFTGDNISRKGRDRGGEGIDSRNESNKGKLVTSKNCDLFVAVNKQNSELFIFGNSEIDSLPEKTFKRRDYMNNWENWSRVNG